MHLVRMTLFTLLALAALVCSGNGQQLSGGKPGCRFAVPAAMASPSGNPSTTWMGGCSNGKAEGSGVIRVPHAGGPLLFLGLVKSGVPQTGVLQDASGQWSGVWKFDAALNTVENPDGDRQVSIDEFRAAAAGARAAASLYRAAGNSSSATYYTSLATRLEKQFDE